jgi:hypothetical protein
MRLVIVDTNVPIAANLESAVSLDCAERCIEAILRVTSGEERLAVDASGLIVGEYANKLSAGQQGVGHEFLKWVYNNQWDESRCEQVAITPDAGSADDSDFVEFPKDSALSTFDRSDRKFVAVSAAHAEHPPILEAADAKWVGWAPALAEAGIVVEFLCAHEIANKYAQNFAPSPQKKRARRG